MTTNEKPSIDIIRDLHVRAGPQRNIFIANVVTAFIIFGLIVASLVLLIAQGETDSKTIVDLFLELFFFIAVVLLILSDMFEDVKTNGHFTK